MKEKKNKKVNVGLIAGIAGMTALTVVSGVGIVGFIKAAIEEVAEKQFL